MMREDSLTLAFVLGGVLGWCLAKLDKLFDRWEVRVRSKRSL